jgi:glycosyltransferase involved in cell wall biosynthesis
MVRAIFLMEQHIGHKTYYENLRHFAEQEQDLECIWVPITYAGSSRLLDAAPGLSKHVRGSLHGALQVRRALDVNTYDIAFFNTQVPAMMAAGQVQRQPYVIATDITPIQYDQMAHLYNHQPDQAGVIANFKHNINVEIMRGATYILPWSSWTRDSLIRDYGVDPRRIEVIAPGVDLNQWKPYTRSGISPLRILFVGGDLYRKGGETLLEAFRALPQGTAELHIVTRTNIPPEPGVHTYYNMRPNSAELITLYRTSDVFVLASAAEAFGIAAAEACAVGLTVIATAVGGLIDLVEDGRSGYVIPVGDTNTLRDRLQRLISNPMLRVQMGRASRKRAERFFDAKANASRIINLLRSATGTLRH